MPGYIGKDPKMALFLDYPSREEDKRHKIGAAESTKLVFWLLDRMSISHEYVLISHTLRCNAPEGEVRTKAQRAGCIEACAQHRFALLQEYKPEVIVAMGKISCEAFLAGAQHGKKEGMAWRPREKELSPNVKVWVTYSPGYALQSPAETGRIYRVIFKAAESINLKPKHNPNVKEFTFDV